MRNLSMKKKIINLLLTWILSMTGTSMVYANLIYDVEAEYAFFFGSDYTFKYSFSMVLADNIGIKTSLDLISPSGNDFINERLSVSYPSPSTTILTFDAPTFDDEFDSLVFDPLSPQSIYFSSFDSFYFDPPLPLPNPDVISGIFSLYAFSASGVAGYCPFVGDLGVLNGCFGELTDLSVKLRESPNLISLPSSLLLAGGIPALWLLAKAALRRRVVRPDVLPTTIR